MSPTQVASHKKYGLSPTEPRPPPSSCLQTKCQKTSHLPGRGQGTEDTMAPSLCQQPLTMVLSMDPVPSTPGAVHTPAGTLQRTSHHRLHRNRVSVIKGTGGTQLTSTIHGHHTLFVDLSSCVHHAGCDTQQDSQESGLTLSH
jgi:hypothetical protein